MLKDRIVTLVSALLTTLKITPTRRFSVESKQLFCYFDLSVTNTMKGTPMKTLFTSLLVLLCVSFVTPQAKKEVKKAVSEIVPSAKPNVGKIWGLTFVDYSYVAQAQDASTERNNAFEFRRIYLGYDQDISEQFSARLLMEANKTETTTSGAMNFYAKQAYVEWKNIVPMSSIFIGLSPTPSLANAERIWGYRSLEKVILDRTGIISINDMGIGLKGKFVPDGSFGYAVMAANGNGGIPENDKLKKFYGAVNFEPSKGSIVEVYADYENGPNGRGKLTGKGLFGYQVPSLSFGVEGFYRNVQHGAFRSVGTSPDSNLVGASANTSFQVAENLRVVLRGDFYDPDFAVKNSGLREIFAVAGLDFVPTKDVHLIPNVLYTHLLYKKKLTTDPTPRDDITVRLTFAYSFAAQIQ
jgi:hypothetical protein